MGISKGYSYVQWRHTIYILVRKLSRHDTTEQPLSWECVPGRGYSFVEYPTFCGAALDQIPFNTTLLVAVVYASMGLFLVK